MKYKNRLRDQTARFLNFENMEGMTIQESEIRPPNMDPPKIPKYLPQVSVVSGCLQKIKDKKDERNKHI